MQQTKRHHYVPKAYLNSFCNQDGKLLIYRKDDSSGPLKLTPDNTQFRRYYYSQPTQDGGQDNNTLEGFFSTIESQWPDTMNILRQRGNSNSKIENIYEFMSLQRARVPASRDMAETMEAQIVKDTLLRMVANGQLPPPPLGLEDLANKVQITIDPHRSIHAMVAMVRSMDKLYERLGFTVLHNTTKREFLTSDNPVLWFDPSLPFLEQKPYTVHLPGQILFFFPVSPRIGILGSNEYLERFRRLGFEHQDTSDEGLIEMLNAQVCRFAYEAVIATNVGQEDLIEEFKNVSPVLEVTSLNTKTGAVTIHQSIFGKRTSKPKWRAN